MGAASATTRDVSGIRSAAAAQACFHHAVSEVAVLEEWANLSRPQMAGTADNNIGLADPVVAERFIRDAFRIIRDALGQPWLDRELDSTRRGGYLLLDGPDDGPPDRFHHLDRLTSLALELHEARFIRGFDRLLAELRRRRMYEAVAELRAVNHMLSAGEDAWFVDPTERVGHTYDGVVVLSGIEVAVEVKAKLPAPVEAFKPASVVNSLRAARKQLPKMGPSIIYLQLASPWTDDPAVMRAVDDALRHWLTSTGRVNGIHVLLERTFIDADERVYLARGSTFVPNLQPRITVPDLNP